MNPYWLVVALALLTQFFVFIRWVHRRVRDDELRRAFVRDIGTNHLPHIYHALRLIAAHLEVEIDEPPPLRFSDLDFTQRSFSDRSSTPRGRHENHNP